MATPQPQPPQQQPIYAGELNNSIDRLYARMVIYADARIDGLAAQMRVFREEAIARDDAIVAQIRLFRDESLARDNELRENMKALADAILKLGQRVSTIETTQTAIIDTLTAMRQEIQDGFIAQREQINELTARVVKLEGGLPPSESKN